MITKSFLTARRKDSHKYDYGHVLIVAGAKGMSGAALLNTWGALRSGAGCVTLAAPRNIVPLISKRIKPDAMILSLPDTPSGTISPNAVSMLLDYIHKRHVQSIAIGSGISRIPSSQKFIRNFFNSLKYKRFPNLLGCVIDADGLLSTHRRTLICPKIPWIITPHEGEFSRLTGLSRNMIHRDRQFYAQQFSKKFHGICVLKGYKTVIASQTQIVVNTTGNPGMAKGGSGDVLTGVIAGLIPQSKDLFDAARWGVYIHGLAGDMVAREKTEIAMLASDIPEMLPRAFAQIRKRF